MPRKKAATRTALPAPLSDIEADLLSHMQHGYQLETSLATGPLLRRLKDDELIRPVSANLNTVKALEEHGLISPVKGRDPLTTIWQVKKTAEKKRKH